MSDDDGNDAPSADAKWSDPDRIYASQPAGRGRVSFPPRTQFPPGYRQQPVRQLGSRGGRKRPSNAPSAFAPPTACRS